jgi:hypothetical protein
MPYTDPQHRVQAISDKQSIQRIQIINLETRLPGQRKPHPGKGPKNKTFTAVDALCTGGGECREDQEAEEDEWSSMKARREAMAEWYMMS